MIVRNGILFGDSCYRGVFARHTVASQERRANFKSAVRTCGMGRGGGSALLATGAVIWVLSFSVLKGGSSVSSRGHDHSQLYPVW